MRMLVAHPSAELYGSDRVALETAVGAREAGWDVEVTLPADGPLVPLLTAAGCRVTLRAAPVLRKAYLSPAGLLRFALLTARRTPAMLRLLRRARPDVVYVSTVTVPWWLLFAGPAAAGIFALALDAALPVRRPVRPAMCAPPR